MTSYIVYRHCYTVAMAKTETTKVSRPMPKTKAYSLRDKLNDQEVKGDVIPENQGKIVSFSASVATSPIHASQASSRANA